jgi:FkbM family methyltransferase
MGFVYCHIERIKKFLNSSPRDRRIRLLTKLVRRFLEQRRTGIVHIGAHQGTEARTYRQLPVLWFEANPELMPDLIRNIAPFPKQRAFNVLLGNTEKEVEFHISSNCGESSSIYQFGSHAMGEQTLWPGFDLQMQRTLTLKMRPMDDVVAESSIDLRGYNFWTLDVQGAELLVVEGATKSLRSCMAMVVEISTVEVYKDAPTYKDLREALGHCDLVPYIEPDQSGLKHGDMLFVRRALNDNWYFSVLTKLASSS